jgi:hypothetical protein
MTGKYIHLPISHEERYMIRSLFRIRKRNPVRPSQMQKLLKLLGVKK